MIASMARSSLRKLSNKPGRRRRGRHAGALPLGHAAIRCALSHEVINNATPLRPCYNIDTNRMGQSGSGCSNEMLMARQRAAYMGTAPAAAARHICFAHGSDFFCYVVWQLIN